MHDNRLGLALCGLALFVAGGYGLLRGLGTWGPGAAAEPLITAAIASFTARNGFFWYGVALATVALAAAGTTWLVSAIRGLGWGGRSAEATVQTAVALKNVSGIQSLGATVSTSRRRSLLQVGITCKASTDLVELCDRIDSDVVPRLRRALHAPDLPIVVRLHVR